MLKKLIEIKGLSYTYPDGTKALDSVGLNIFEGDSTGIIGPNGSGKSTLLLHLNGILRGGGQVKVLDMEAEEQSLNFIRSKIGLVFQNPDDQLFMPTVFDDVAFGPINMGLSGAEVEVAVKRALAQVDMSGAIKRSSHHLSLGEKRRVSIATVLSMNPEMLVLDEPTSNLDPKHRRELIELLGRLNLTKAIATHDLSMVMETCSKVVVIDQGKIVAAGDTFDILKDRDLLEEHDLEMPGSLLYEQL